MSDVHTNARLDQIDSNLRRLRLEQAMQSPGYVPPSKPGAARMAIFSGLGLLLFFEAIAPALLTWGYFGSEKGSNLRMDDGSIIGGLHWDPFGVLLMCVAVFFGWAILFTLPLIGPIMAVLATMVWGAIVYMASGSIAAAIFIMVLSMILRIAEQFQTTGAFSDRMESCGDRGICCACTRRFHHAETGAWRVGRNARLARPVHLRKGTEIRRLERSVHRNAGVLRATQSLCRGQDSGSPQVMMARVCPNCGSAVAADKPLPLFCGQCRAPMPAPETDRDRIAGFIERHKKTLEGLARK